MKCSRGGFTLVEVLVTLVILILLLTLIVPNFAMLRAKAEGVVCASHLRGLWTGFSAYMNDGNCWPQKPGEVVIGSRSEQQWWLTNSVETMGISAREWTCPTIARNQRRLPEDQRALISYWANLFGNDKNQPRKFPRNVWFAEMDAVHGPSPLSVRADGSVCPLSSP